MSLWLSLDWVHDLYIEVIILLYSHFVLTKKEQLLKQGSRVTKSNDSQRVTNDKNQFSKTI